MSIPVMKPIGQIDTAALDRAVRIVMPDVIGAMHAGPLENTYVLTIRDRELALIAEYHRQRGAA